MIIVQGTGGLAAVMAVAMIADIVTAADIIAGIAERAALFAVA